MAKRAPNYCLVLCMFLVALGITYWARTRPALALNKVDVHAFPKTIGKWNASGSDEKLPKEVLGGWGVSAKDFLARNYTDDQGEHINLMVVYKGRDRRNWHLSEMCFSGSGYNVAQSRTDIPYGSASSAVKLVAEDPNSGTKEIALYWFAQGAHGESNFLKQQLDMALTRVRPSKQGWAFVRVVSPVTISEEDTIRMLKDFIKNASDPLVTSFSRGATPGN